MNYIAFKVEKCENNIIVTHANDNNNLKTFNSIHNVRDYIKSWIIEYVSYKIGGEKSKDFMFFPSVSNSTTYPYGYYAIEDFDENQIILYKKTYGIIRITTEIIGWYQYKSISFNGEQYNIPPPPPIKVIKSNETGNNFEQVLNELKQKIKKYQIFDDTENINNDDEQYFLEIDYLLENSKLKID